MPQQLRSYSHFTHITDYNDGWETFLPRMVITVLAIDILFVKMPTVQIWIFTSLL